MGTGTAIILAGGESRRMGFDKQKLLINGKLVALHIAEKLKDEFDQIIIVSNKPVLYGKSDYMIIEDRIRNIGPLGGIYTGLLESKSEAAYITACDMPHISLDYIRYLKEVLRHNPDADAIITRYLENMMEPFNAIYSKNCIGHIEELLGGNKTKISSLCKEINTYYVDETISKLFSPDWGMFMNLNTKHDLEEFADLEVS